MVEIDGIKMYTIEDIAEKFKLNYLVIQRSIKKMRAVKIGNKWYVSSDNIKSFLNGDIGNLQSTPQAKPQKHVVAIKYKCHTCKKDIDPKADIYHYFESGKVEPLRFCSKQHLDDMRRKPGKKVKNEVA